MKILSKVLSIALLILATAAHADPISATGYDAKADPNALVDNAVKEARLKHKQVLVIAGGQWCRWCMALEAFVSKNPDVKAALNNAFVPIEVYYGDENTNDRFFAKLPKAKGYPHFWVVNKDGKVTKSVDTGGIEDGHGSYEKEKVLKLIKEMNAA